MLRPSYPSIHESPRIMSKIKIALTDATRPQLFQFATVTLGLEIPNTANSAGIIGRIAAADPNITEFEIEEAEAAPVKESVGNVAKPAAMEGKLTTHYSDDPKVLVMIPSVHGKGGDRDVQIAHNGDIWLMKRDQEVALPYRAFIALKDAREMDYRQTEALPGKPAEMISREVPSYSYQVSELPSKAEIAAWEKRMEQVELGEPIRVAA